MNKINRHFYSLLQKIIFLNTSPKPVSCFINCVYYINNLENTVLRNKLSNDLVSENIQQILTFLISINKFFF